MFIWRRLGWCNSRRSRLRVHVSSAGVGSRSHQTTWRPLHLVGGTHRYVLQRNSTGTVYWNLKSSWKSKWNFVNPYRKNFSWAEFNENFSSKSGKSAELDLWTPWFVFCQYLIFNHLILLSVGFSSYISALWVRKTASSSRLWISSAVSARRALHLASVLNKGRLKDERV